MTMSTNKCHTGNPARTSCNLFSNQVQNGHLVIFLKRQIRLGALFYLSDCSQVKKRRCFNILSTINYISILWGEFLDIFFYKTH